MANVRKSSKKRSTKNKPKEKKHIIDLGRFHDYIKLDQEIRKMHELTDDERKCLVADFKKVKKLEKGEEIELKAIKHFEKKLQELISDVIYLEGYIQQIEEGQAMLKINPSVKELGNKLVEDIKEIELLSSSMLTEERKIFALAKQVNQILDKAKKYQSLIFS